jgi:hypothetical protein
MYHLLLLIGAKAIDKVKPDSRHLPHQRVATSHKGQLAHQGSGGLGRDVRVVGVYGVQSPLGVEPAQPTEQGISAPLQRRWSRP